MPNKFVTVTKIVSGGQTGADRAAWDFALAKNIPIGGYVPRGRLAEDGIIDLRYGRLIETDSEDPSERTKLNVLAANATLIFYRDELIGGTRLTLELAEQSKKPHLKIDLNQSTDQAADRLLQWLELVAPGVLNVAGPRESECPGVYSAVLDLLTLCVTSQTKRGRVQ